MISGREAQNGTADGALLIVPVSTAGGLGVTALADMDGVPMVMHVWRRAVEARVGRVVVAAADPGIVDAVLSFGGQAVALAADRPGSIAVAAAALHQLDPDRRAGAVMCVPCVYPTITPRAVQRCLQTLAEPVVDIATLAAPIVDEVDKADPTIIKAALVLTPGRAVARVTDFARLAPPGAQGTQFRHIEVYAWRRTVIENFVLLPPSVRETQQRIVQLRAIDAGMRVDAALVDTAPRRVDTPADLEHVRATLATKSNIQ